MSHEIHVSRQITLSAPLDFDHYGGPEYFAEVALLSRSVTFQGAKTGVPTKHRWKLEGKPWFSWENLGKPYDFSICLVKSWGKPYD
jgi:hypothetical protein